MAPHACSELSSCHNSSSATRMCNRELPSQKACINFDEMDKRLEAALKLARKLMPENTGIETTADGRAAIKELLRKLSTLEHEFNVFDLSKVTDKPLKFAFLGALQDFGLIEKLEFPFSKVERLADSLQAVYNANSYHSATHAADTTQMMAHLLHQDNLAAAMSPLEMFAALLAAAGHDAAHCGVRNVSVPAVLEQVFGKQGSQEHMHAEVTCSLLHQSGLFEGREEEFAAVCSIMKQLIHATDMALHAQVNSYVTSGPVAQAIADHGLDYAKWPCEARLLLLCFALHWADISNVARQFATSAGFAVLLGHEVSPAGAAKGNAAAAAAAATAVEAAAHAEGMEPQAAAATAIAADVMAATRSSGNEQQPALEELLQAHEMAAVAANQRGFMLNFAAATLQQLHLVLPKAAAEAQQHFSSNLAHWEAILNNNEASTATS